MKRKISLLISITLLITLLTIFITYYNYKPRLTYKYSNEYDGYLVYKAYGDKKKYKIKEEFNNKKIVGISTRAFYNHKNLKTIEFENSENIKYIGRLSFSKCKNLSEIDLSYVSLIDKNAFSYCYKLDNISIMASDILGSAFYKCKSLTNIELNEGVETIGTYAFSYTNFNELKLPHSMIECYIDSFKYSNLNKIYYYNSFKPNDYLLNSNIELVKI